MPCRRGVPAGTGALTFAVQVSIPKYESGTLKNDVYEGRVAVPAGGDKTIQSARVVWDASPPFITVPVSSTLHPGVQPMTVSLSATAATSESVYIYSLRLVPL